MASDPSSAIYCAIWGKSLASLGFTCEMGIQDSCKYWALIWHLVGGKDWRGVSVMGRNQGGRAEGMSRREEVGLPLPLDSRSLGKGDLVGSDGLNCPVDTGQFWSMRESIDMKIHSPTCVS